LPAERIGQYHVLKPTLLPEAFPQLHSAFYSPKQGGRSMQQQEQGKDGLGTEAQQLRKGGCKGLQLEMKVAGMFPTNSAQSSTDSAASHGTGAGTSKHGGLEQGPALMWRAPMQQVEDQLLK